jgi:hypothetical protein
MNSNARPTVANFIDQLEALLREATEGDWTIYDSNSWRRIGLKNDYRETLWPCRLRDGHPDLSGVNRDADLALLMFLQNHADALLSVVKAAQEVDTAGRYDAYALAKLRQALRALES